MDVRIAVVADYASLDKADKLSVNGVFGWIYGFAEPIVHTKMYLVFQLEFPTLETGSDKNINIVLQDADAKELLSISGIMAVPTPPNGLPALVSQAIQIGVVNFPHFGTYEFKIQVGDEPEIVIPITVAKMVGQQA